MLKKDKRGQSTLEYIILATAVIVIIIALVAGNNSPFKNALNKTFTTSTNAMEGMADRFDTSINMN